MNKTTRIPILDGLRVIAIIMVMLFHFYSRFGSRYYSYTIHPLTIFKYGNLGVELFFIISGFVIALTLNHCDNYIYFIKKRFIRLFPGMLICSILTFIIITIFDTSNLFPVSKSILNLFISNTFISPGYTNLILRTNLTYVDGAYWSIGVEIQFYLIAGLIYFISKKSFIKNYLLFALFSSFIYIIFSYHESFLFMKTLVGSSNYDRIHQSLRAFPLFEYNMWFSIGILFNRLYDDKKNNVLIGSLIICYVLQAFYLSDLIPIYFAVCTMFIFSLLVYFPKFLRLLGAKIFQIIGLSSYSIYLIHQHIGVLIINKFSKYFGNLNWMLPIIIIVAVFIFGYLSYRYFEEPFSKKLRLYMINIRKQPAPIVSEISDLSH